MRLYTIGFTEKSAKRFFWLLGEHNIALLADVRLRPDGQLSGFAKKADLPFFLERLIGGTYTHMPELSPTGDILDVYRKEKDWSRYVLEFEHLMDTRGIPNALNRQTFEQQTVCLMCSEASPSKCHRRLVAERLARVWQEVEIIHLV